MTFPCDSKVDCADVGPFENLSAEAADTLDFWPTQWIPTPTNCVSTVSQSAADACADALAA